MNVSAALAFEVYPCACGGNSGRAVGNQPHQGVSLRVRGQPFFLSVDLHYLQVYPCLRGAEPDPCLRSDSVPSRQPLQLAGWIRTLSSCHAISPRSISLARPAFLWLLAMTAQQRLPVRRCISAAWLRARLASCRSPV